MAFASGWIKVHIIIIIIYIQLRAHDNDNDSYYSIVIVMMKNCLNRRREANFNNLKVLSLTTDYIVGIFRPKGPVEDEF